MGRLADVLDQQAELDKLNDLKIARQQFRQLGGVITNLAGSYQSIVASAQDDSDKTKLDALLVASVSGLKSDIDALDVDHRALVDKVFLGLGYRKV